MKKLTLLLFTAILVSCDQPKEEDPKPEEVCVSPWKDKASIYKRIKLVEKTVDVKIISIDSVEYLLYQQTIIRLSK